MMEARRSLALPLLPRFPRPCVYRDADGVQHSVAASYPYKRVVTLPRGTLGSKEK